MIINKILLTVSLSLLFIQASFACDIVIKKEGAANKKSFVPGEEVLINIHVKHIHRVCRLDIEDTRVETQGLKIEKSTAWKEIEPGLWEQRLKMKVTGSPGGQLKVKVSRECSRGYHEAEFTLLSKAI